MTRVAASRFGCSDDTSIVAAAAQSLGWIGAVVGPTRILGKPVWAVVQLCQPSLEDRKRTGQARPVTDIDLLAISEWAGPHGATPSPLALVGILVEGETWRQAHKTARQWRAFGPTAIVVDSVEAGDVNCQLECAYSGIAIVAAHSGKAPIKIQEGATTRAQGSRRRPLDRWVEERLYGELAT